MAQYTYVIDGVTVGFDPHVIRIHNDSALADFLWKWGHGAVTLATDCKDKYRSLYGTDINITTDSLTVEILGHFHAPGLLALAKAGSLVGIPSPLVTLLISVLEVIVKEHVAIIDCGEAGYDSNRGVWDALAPYRGVIEAVLVD